MKKFLVCLVIAIASFAAGYECAREPRPPFNPDGMYVDAPVYKGQVLRLNGGWWKVKRAGQSELKHTYIFYGYFAQWVELEPISEAAAEESAQTTHAPKGEVK